MEIPDFSIFSQHIEEVLHIGGERGFRLRCATPRQLKT